MSSFDPELPPTAGLPLYLKDLLPGRAGDFSQQLAAFLDVPEVGVECSGTASLIVILETLRRRSHRTHVVIPAYTCPLVVFAVARCGLQVQVCDVRPRSFEFDPEALAKLCDDQTLAVIPTHLGGRVAEMVQVIAVARRCGAYVIEDAAQALGARSYGKSVGIQGDAGFFSLAAGKGLTLFEGGIWLAADADLQAELKNTAQRIVPHHWGWEALRCLELLGYALAYRPRGLPYVYGRALRQALRQNDPVAAAGDYFSPDIPVHRVSQWRQAVGSRALSRLPGFQRELTLRAAERLPRLLDIRGVEVLLDAPGVEGTWPVFIVLLPSETMRDRVLGELWGAGVGVARMFAFAVPDYDYLKPWISHCDTPNARAFAACSFTITNSPWLDEAQFEQILRVLSRHCY
jgi:dTDP-4-amino-4,6-dideoxygalactose transaminase